MRGQSPSSRCNIWHILCQNKSKLKSKFATCNPMTLFFTGMPSPRNHQKILLTLFQVPTNEEREERNKFNLKH
jgi:hypothetical protein